MKNDYRVMRVVKFGSEDEPIVDVDRALSRLWVWIGSEGGPIVGVDRLTQ